MDDLWSERAHSGSGSSGLRATDQAEPAQSIASRGAARRQSTPEGIGINPTFNDATALRQGRGVADVRHSLDEPTLAGLKFSRLSET